MILGHSWYYSIRLNLASAIITNKVIKKTYVTISSIDNFDVKKKKLYKNVNTPILFKWNCII